MSDRDKTRIQLLDEVKGLRQQIADFEQLQNEHQQIVDKLKESERQYRIIAENTHDWEFWLNADDRLIHTSPSCRRITGYDQEDFKKDPNLLFKIIHPNDRSIFDDHRRLAHKTQSPGEEEFRIVRKDGETRWVTQFCQPVYDDAGQYAGICASNRDSTDLKKIDNERNESERHNRLLADNTSDMIWTRDMNLQLTYISPSVEQLRGYTADEAMTQTLYEALTPASFKLATEIWEEELALEYSGKADRNRSRTISLECLCKDGSTVWTESKITPVRDADGKMIEILGVSRDITERRSAEEKLLASENQLQENENWLRAILGAFTETIFDGY